MAIDVAVTALPGERALLNVERGIDDGDALRVGGLENVYANLRRVPEQIHVMDFVAFSKRQDIQVSSWSDLAPFEVGIIRGWKILEQRMDGRVGVTVVKNADQLFTLLDHGQIDVALFEYWQAAPVIKRLGAKFKAHAPPLASMPMFLYVNKKHENLIGPIAASIRDMKASRRISRLRSEFLEPWKIYFDQH